MTPVVSSRSDGRVRAPSCARSRSRSCASRRLSRASRGASQVASAASSESVDVVIVGGGVSGLCAAQALLTEHRDAFTSLVVTEGRERVGGNITSRSDERGYVWEEGPNSFQPNVSMMKATVDTGLKEKLVLGDPTAPRFVLWDKKLRKTPSGPDVVTFDLLSIWGKIRAGLGALGIMNGKLPDYEESVEQFVKRNLGDEAFYRLIEPFCSGVYAGDPSKLSMKAAFGKVHVLEEKGGSIMGGSLKFMQEQRDNPPPPPDPRLPQPKGQTVGSYREGLQTLPNAIEAYVRGEQGDDAVRCDWKLTAISRDETTGKYNLSYDTPDGARTLVAKSVALTVPAYVAAPLIKSMAGDASDKLLDIYYPPVAAVTIAYPEEAVRDESMTGPGRTLEGFGQLHPRTQGVTTLGTIYSSALFPGRVPKGQVLILNYIGGCTNTGIVDQSEDEIVAQVDKDLRTMLLKPDAPAPTKVGLRIWPKAIPQFNVGHFDRVNAAKDGLKQAGCSGLFLGGNYVSGVALGKCVEYGYVNLAGEIAEHARSVKEEVKEMVEN
ncbi:protoporphyrinogen oxidase [Pseudoscourfieldia marina]